MSTFFCKKFFEIKNDVGRRLWVEVIYLKINNVSFDFLLSPLIENCYSVKVTALSWLVVPEDLSVQEVPSEDVIMVQ